MANDGVMLGAIAQQLNRELNNGRIEKIVQPNGNDTYLSVRCEKRSVTILLSASAEFAGICLTDTFPITHDRPPMFCSILRKYLTNGRIMRVTQVGNERIVEFGIEAADELGDRHEYRLICEIMGRCSNLILVDKNGKILDSAKRVTVAISRVRQVLPGLPYVCPPQQQDKIDPYEFDFTSLEIPQDEKVEAWLTKRFIGVCKTTARMATADPEGIAAYFQRLQRKEFNPGILKNDDGSVADYVGIGKDGVLNFSPMGASEAITTYAEQHGSDRAVSLQIARVERALTETEKKCRQKIELFSEGEKMLAQAERDKLFGELLNANLYALKQGMKRTEVLDYYSGENVVIPLDSDLSPQENAQRYYKQCTRNKSKFENATVMRKNAEEELACLMNLWAELEALLKVGTDVQTVEEKLLSLGYMKNSGGRKQETKEISRPIHYRSKDGYDIFVGRNAVQNDKLTGSASPKDRWFHVKDCPGSHVILRNKKGEFSDEATVTAALLAAYHSTNKNGVKVAVDYTEVRYVDKIHGSKSGAVTYINQKTAFVTPTYDVIATIRRIL